LTWDLVNENWALREPLLANDCRCEWLATMAGSADGSRSTHYRAGGTGPLGNPAAVYTGWFADGHNEAGIIFDGG